MGLSWASRARGRGGGKLGPHVWAQRSRCRGLDCTLGLTKLLCCQAFGPTPPTQKWWILLFPILYLRFLGRLKMWHSTLETCSLCVSMNRYKISSIYIYMFMPSNMTGLRDRIGTYQQWMVGRLGWLTGRLVGSVFSWWNVWWITISSLNSVAISCSFFHSPGA